MRKVFSLFVACIIALSLPCFYVNALESDKISLDGLTRDELLELGYKYFPEYRDNTSKQRSAGDATNCNDELVVCEAKQVSEELSVTYYEFANGYSVIGFTETVDVTSSSSGSGYMNRTVKVTVVGQYSDSTMVISGIQYTILSGEYDRINSCGSSLGGGYTQGTLGNVKLNEDRSGEAHFSYTGAFYPNEQAINNGMTTAFYVTLTFYVGNDGATTSLAWS